MAAGSTAESGEDRALQSEDETDDDDSDDYVDDLPAQIAAKKNKGPRASVSAEAFGSWN